MDKQTKETVITYEVTREPIRQEILHVDFMRIDMNKSISTTVAFTGNSTSINVERCEVANAFSPKSIL